MPVAEFVIYTIVNVPINVVWQNWLESVFPSSTAPAEVKDEKKGSKAPAKKEGGLSVTNTLAKFAMDQTVGAMINIPLFIATIGLTQGKTTEQIINTIRAVSGCAFLLFRLYLAECGVQDALSIYIAGAKLWPAVSLISYIAVPVERRVIFGSIAGVAWNIYLSLMARN